MDSDSMQNMMNMMGQNFMSGMTNMRDMMAKMMPQGISMALTSMNSQERLLFVEETISLLIKKGCEGLSEADKKNFIESVVKKIQIM